VSGQPAPLLRGARVLLRPPRAADREARQAYGFDAGIERGYGHVTETRPMSDEEADEYWARVQAAAGPTYWMVEVDGALVGTTFLHSLDERDRRARFAIGLLSPRLQHRGIGREATGLVLDHAFGDLGLHRVDLRVLAFNETAVRCYEACGFVHEGRERESCLIDGQWYDDLLMAKLAHEHLT
jgi:RimJ/RimL family protein N-acetyltransferase